MESRVLSLFVENNVGVLAKISTLFSGKMYNLESLTVGVTEDETVSRMTIRVKSGDATFEQIKKQLNRCVEVIKVVDLTGRPVYMKELMLIKISKCAPFTASSTAAALADGLPSKIFSLIVPLNKKLSWKTIAICARSDCKSISRISVPSMRTLPLFIS